MKKFRMSPVIVILLLVSIFVIPADSFADENETDEEYSALIETGFESNKFEGWASFGNSSKLAVTNEQAHSGKYSVIASERKHSWSGPSLNVTDFAVSGGEYLFRAYVMSESDEEINIMMSLKYTDISGEESFETIASHTITDTNWTMLENRVYIPENTENVLLYFETESGLEDFYVDDISIYGLGQETPHTGIADESSIKFDFEDDLCGWIPRGRLNIDISDDHSYSGKKSLYSSERTEFWNAPVVRLATVKPLTNYTYSAYVMYIDRECDNDHVFSLMLQYSLDGEEVYAVIGTKALRKGAWSKITGDIIIPENASDVYLYVQADGSEDGRELISFYVDNVSVIDTTAALKKRTVTTALISAVSAIFITLITLAAVKEVKKSREARIAIKLASVDAMTNTFNRNVFEEYIEQLEASPEKCRGIYVTACDVNFLKYINDNYGHSCGDDAIIRCASVLRRAVGKNGNVYRIGGDEFMCISKIDCTDAIKVEFARENIEYKGYPFSVAVGTAHYDPIEDAEEADIKVLIARSDKAMYQHKMEIKKTVDFID